MDLLWPDSSSTVAANNLRQPLHAARKVFDPAQGYRSLVSEYESLTLCRKGRWVDTESSRRQRRGRLRRLESVMSESSKSVTEVYTQLNNGSLRTRVSTYKVTLVWLFVDVYSLVMAGILFVLVSQLG